MSFTEVSLSCYWLWSYARACYLVVRLAGACHHDTGAHAVISSINTGPWVDES